MTERYVWIVWGTHGYYSNRTEWNVRVFDTEAEAIAWKDACIRRAVEVREWFADSSRQAVTHERARWASEYDQAVVREYTNGNGVTTYYVNGAWVTSYLDDMPHYDVQRIPFGVA